MKIYINEDEVKEIIIEYLGDHIGLAFEKKDICTIIDNVEGSITFNIEIKKGERTAGD